MAETTTTVRTDDHRHGWNADDGLVDLCLFGIYGAGWIFFTILQMTSTEDSVFGLLQTSFTVAPSATAQQLTNAINGALDREHLIAFGIALSVQLFLITLAFPTTRALLLAHKKTSSPSSASTGREAEEQAKWMMIVTRFLVGADIITDFAYVIQGHNVFSGTFLWFIPALSPNGGAGILLVGIIYPIAVCGATIFFANLAFKRLGSLVYRLRANVKK